MTEELYDAKPGPKLLWLRERGGHDLPLARDDRVTLGRKLDALLALAHSR